MAGCPLVRARVWAAPLNEAMDLADISTPVRAADFIAQIGHESLGLRFTSEIWGPSQVPEQLTYERDPIARWGPDLRRGDRNFKAWKLGNSQAGDGRRFCGHGPIQITGRFNHARVTSDLLAMGMEDVPDFELVPEALAEPRWGALSAALFWKRNGLNAYADRGDFIGQTERINGGQNGLEDRLARRLRARTVLGAVR